MNQFMGTHEPLDRAVAANQADELAALAEGATVHSHAALFGPC
jgi:hypothetical protein